MQTRRILLLFVSFSVVSMFFSLDPLKWSTCVYSQHQAQAWPHHSWPMKETPHHSCSPAWPNELHPDSNFIIVLQISKACMQSLVVTTIDRIVDMLF